jgi:hypothetical protein
MSKLLHELNSTLATLHIQASSIEKFFPALLEGYRLAKENKFLESPLQDRQLELLQSLTKGLLPGLQRLESLIAVAILKN